MANQTTTTKPTPPLRANKCANCGTLFRSKRITKKCCGSACQRAAKRAAGKTLNPRHQDLHNWLKGRGFIGQVWPVYRWDNSPKIFGLLVPPDFAAAELCISEPELGQVLDSFGIVKFKSNIVEWEIWDFYKAKKHKRIQHAGDRFPVTPPANKPKGSRPRKAHVSRAQVSPSISFSVPVDLVGGSSRHWPGATRIDPDLRREILDTVVTK